MASPIGFGDCLAIIQEGIRIYHKIQDAKQQVKDMGERLEGIKKYINRIQSIITDNKQSALAKLRPDLTNDINDILRRIKKDARQVSSILKAWHECEGPFGFTWTSQTVSNFFNGVFSGKPDDLEKLNKRLEREETEMRDWFAMLNSVGIDELLKQSDKTALKPAPSPGRSPSPMRSNYNIIFIDSFNEGRSVIAQSYALLVREWTIRTQNRWPLSLVHSVGLLTRSRSAFTTQLESLRMTLRDGNTAPSFHAINALFDAPTFNYPYKALIRKGASERKSRGLPANLFTTYDFILVFNRIDAANLERLKELLRSQHHASQNSLGPVKGQPMKAKLRLLGDYGNTGKSEIWNPPKSDDEKVMRQKWNGVVGNIKNSFKGFLKKETGWVQPKAGAVQS